MEFISKFNIGDEVYFYNAKSAKMERGIITGVCLFARKDKIEWDYLIREKSKSELTIDDRIDEAFVFRDRDEVFKFAYQITENI